MGCFRHSWKADEPRATVVLVHGTGEHHGRYEHVARFFTQRGITVQSGDLPGWGRSSGLKGHIGQFDEYIDAVAIWVQDAQQTTQKPVFLLGHSLGGLIVTRYIEKYAGRHQLDGLILSSPCLQLKMEVPQWKRGLADMLDKVWPTLRLSNDIAPNHVSRDPVVQAAYIRDPYNFPKVSVRWFTELLKAMEAAWQKRQQIDLPVLTVQAGADSIIDADAIERFVNELPVADKEYERFEGLYHEVMNEPERDIVLARIGDWLDKRIHK